MQSAKTKKCPKALRKRAVDCTNQLFESCVREVLGLHTESVEDLETAMDFIRQAQTISKFGPLTPGTYDEDEVSEMKQAQEQVSALYQIKMKKLPTKILNEILKAHNLEGGIKRAPQTVESILSELASRSILGDDTNESDFILNNGDVDEPTRKSKSNRSKAPNKRRKASKDR